MSIVKDSFYHWKSSGNPTVLDELISGGVCIVKQLEDDTVAAVFSWELRHDTVSGFDTEIKEKALPSVNCRGVERIAAIRGTACWAAGTFAVVNTKIVIQPTRHSGFIS